MNELTQSKVETLVRRILSAYTFDADKLSVRVTPHQLAYAITVKASKGDTRRIVGKGGANINALRGYFRSLGYMHRLTIDLDLDEPDPSPDDARRSVKAGEWNADEMEKLLRELCNAAFRFPDEIIYKFHPDGEGVRVEITVSGDEHPKRQLEICTALRTLSNFIGWIHQKRVHLNIVPGEKSSQPDTAAGRFAAMT